MSLLTTEYITDIETKNNFMLKGKKIIIGVTAGIAAYKTPLLVRQFIKAGAEVKTILTPASLHFITPLTLSTLSKNAVISEFYNKTTGEWVNHVDLGLWADIIIIAPATSNSIGKLANGIADNILLTTYLSAKCPVFIAPAMDRDMAEHPSVLRNIDTLKKYGNHIIDYEYGELASGLIGNGRMAEPEKIFNKIKEFFK
jgi:phosphopantothenoylcysteine decarboxylase / phosphopantothenate---cysteine ligase